MASRLITFTATAAVGLLILAGCGRADPDAADEPGGEATDPTNGEVTGTVTMWAMGAEGDLLGDFVTGFEEANPGVTVEVTPIPWANAHDRFQTAIAGGVTPDIAMMGTTWMADFQGAFAAVPSSIDSSAFFESSIETAELDGQLRGLPWYIDVRPYFYRTDLAAEAGWDEPATTMDEFKEMARDLQALDGVDYGVRLPTAAADSFQNAMWMPWSFGAQLVNDEGSEWTIDTPEMLEGLEYYSSFFEEGIADPNADISDGAQTAEFVAGTTAIVIEGGWLRGQLTQLGGEEFSDQYAVALIPEADSGTAFVGGANLVVFEGAENPTAAWALADWFTSAEVQLEFWELAGNLPSTLAAWDDPALADDDFYSVFGQQMSDSQAVPAVTTWTQVLAAGDVVLEEIARGVTTPAEALSRLQDQADQIGFE